MLKITAWKPSVIPKSGSLGLHLLTEFSFEYLWDTPESLSNNFRFYLYISINIILNSEFCYKSSGESILLFCLLCCFSFFPSPVSFRERFQSHPLWVLIHSITSNCNTSVQLSKPLYHFWVCPAHALFMGYSETWGVVYTTVHL